MSDKAPADPKQLLDLARGGSVAALGQLLELYRNYLTVLARLQIGQRLQGKADAADLVQDAFLQAYSRFAQFAGTTEGELVAWLRQILASRLTKLLRRYYGTGRRDVRLERELAEDLAKSSRVLDGALVSPSSSPSHQAARREQAVLLADALEQLPEDYREVLVLRHVQGLSFPEVARRLGRSVDSVEKVWTRALDRLRRVLGGGS
jgi:RNA polymerase sigma-70 factor (ECF subfamily)